MTKERFHCKTNHIGITITFAVIVMSLLFMTSCGKENKEIVVVEFDPETTYTMKATDVTSFISDSGVTRYRAVAKVWLTFDKAKEPYYYFPEGIYIEKFDTLFNIAASVKADTAYYWSNIKLAKLVGNVEIENPDGERFETSLLFLNEKDDRAWSDQFIRIEQEDKIITGIGFESNLNMTQYMIFNSTGEFPVKDAAPDSTATKDARPVAEGPPTRRITPLQPKEAPAEEVALDSLTVE